MSNVQAVRVRNGLELHGIHGAKSVAWNPPTTILYEEAIRRGEAHIGQNGPLVVNTGRYTGRSPNDKFIVKEPSSEQYIRWGSVNVPMDPSRYAGLRARMMAYLEGKDLWVQDCFAGADQRYRLPLRIVTETAWHSLFARNLFIQATPEEAREHTPQLTVIQAPGFHADPVIDGTTSNAFIILNFAAGEVLIGGTGYAGEIKKSVFSYLNYVLPDRGVFPMHCSANVGAKGDVAIFFGLSGTGKTTLSTTSDRRLVGDDEHGWSEDGVFNFEGGCYAKVIKLSAEAEPEIYATTRRFGTVLENVVFDPATRELDLDNDTLTENTRGAYPISFLPNALDVGMAGPPTNVIMITADAFGVLPPVAKLTPEQAMYYFLSGYTAKVAGTERGIKEPQATFSSCFGAPFMPRDPVVYAEMLKERIGRHGAQVWLVNTGWSGGPYGVGQRFKIKHTRAMLGSIVTGQLADTEMRTDALFGLRVPVSCPDVPPNILDPRGTWKDAAAYDRQAAKLVGMFHENFQQFAGRVSEAVSKAGPSPLSADGSPA